MEQQKEYILESAVNNVQEALDAEQRGAKRIEQCIRLDLGGLTPTNEELLEGKQKLKIPVSVMIRPRDGNFVYNKEEIEQMKESIKFCKENGIYGVVFGILKEDQTLDIEANKELVELSKGMSVTFHRAFDEVKDPLQTLEKLIDLGFNRLLTSGQAPKATEGIDMLKKCIEVANGRIIIMPGSGVNKDNLKMFQDQLNTNEFHGTKIV